MGWLLQGAILVAVGVVLRRLLHMGGPRLRPYHGPALLNREQARIYDLVVRDVEGEAAILGIALNQAIEERNSGNSKVAWRFVQLAASEWDRLAGTLVTLLSQMSKYLPVALVDSPVRRMRPERFKSKSMIDQVRLHQMLAQFVLRSKLRFQLHLRVLRRAVEVLTAEFWHLHKTAECSEAGPPEFWGHLDLYSHDLDLLAKETLLAMRALLPGVSEGELMAFSSELHAQSPRLALLDDPAQDKKLLSPASSPAVSICPQGSRGHCQKHGSTLTRF
jgi:hypothetical protein